MPSAVRAARSATISGFSAATSNRAVSFTAPSSPRGAASCGSCGMTGASPAFIASSCNSWSIASTVGPYGGVMENLCARVADSAK